MMEALYPSVTVEHRYCSTIPDCSSHPSRSVPVFEIGEKTSTSWQSPGRTEKSLMEVPEPVKAVAICSSSSCPSRPGPAFDIGDGIFQLATPGKYQCVKNPTLPDASLCFSHTDVNICAALLRSSDTTISSPPADMEFTSPRRTPQSILEAPEPSDPVEPATPTSTLSLSGVSCHQSRLGPAVGNGEGVFQSALPGKYFYSTIHPPPDSFVVSSPSPSDVSNSACTQPRSQTDPVFTIYYQNVRGLRTKTTELRLMLSTCDYDVLVLTETWLRADIQDCELSSDYHFFRCDRTRATSQLSRGGGVLIAVKSMHSCTSVSLENCDRLEQVAVRITLQHRSLFITGIYLRPLSSPDLYTSHTNAQQNIFERSSNADIILAMGDYNLPFLSWTFDEDVNGYLPSNASTEQELALTEPMLASGLIQVNSLTNLNGRLLDLAFISDADNVNLLEPPVPLLDIDHHHRPFILRLDADCNPLMISDCDSYPPELDFRLCDFESLNNELSTLNWQQILDGVSVNAIADQFYDNLYETLYARVPLRRRVRRSTSMQPWWSPELRNLRNVLRKSRKCYFSTRTNESKISLRLIETRYNGLLKSTYEEYVQRIQMNLKQHPSAFWKFVKSQRSGNRIPDKVEFNGITASSPVDVANLFASFFQSVYNTNSPPPNPASFDRIHEYNLNFPTLCFSPDDVMTALNDLDVSKGPGVDGIPPSLLKYCARSLASPISCIFNRSLSERSFPNVWKTASIVPIHKAGNRNRAENYRGISLLCCISKVFETLLHNALYNVVHPVVSEFQHGFVQHRSTTTNLLCYTNTLFREVESRRQVDSIYIDFSKAFDTVPHVYATEKLRAIGFPTWLVEWILSYLTDRHSFVSINSARSTAFAITSGVPQGSVLGPMLFVLFVNDLCPRISSFKQMFADDLKMYRVIATVLDCLALQTDINELLLWCQENGMSVNIRKCKVISFSRRSTTVNHQYTIGSVPLERVTSICDLGVTIDSKMRFNEHVALVTAKASTVLGCIRRYTWKFTDIFAQKTLFCTLVRSILEYAASIWTPYHASLIIRVEKIQKLFIRFALRNLPWNDPLNLPDYAARCMLINLETLRSRRTNIQQLVIFDLLRGNIDCPQLLQDVPLYVPPRQLRTSQLVAVPAHRTGYGYNNPFDACLRAFNDTNDHFDFGISKSAFKNRIKNIR